MKVDEVVLIQKNKSNILLEENVNGSSRKRNRCINIRYYMVKTIVDNSELTIGFVPQRICWLVFLRKKLQKKIFIISEKRE